MMIYLTGANTSLAKTSDNPQYDPSKSLGGYISSTPVPNAAINTLFDLISSYTLDKKQNETIAIGLINKLTVDATNVELKIVTDVDNAASFKIAAVPLDSNYLMEQIANRYQEPIQAEFFDVSFYRASVDLEIIQYATAGEEIILYPFNVSVKVSQTGIEGTWDSFYEAFSNNLIYEIKRVSDTIFRISRIDETVITNSLPCSYITTEGFTASFSGSFGNKADNTGSIIDVLHPQQAIGIWIQRIINKNNYLTNDDLLQNYKDGYISDTIEEVEMIISYS